MLAGDKLKSGQLSANSKSKKQPLSRTKSLVPSSNLPGEISEKSNLVERTKSEGSSVKLDAEREKMLPKMGNPGYSSTGYGSWSAGTPHISLTSESSQHSHPPTSNMSGGWATIPSALPHNIAGSCAEMFLEPDGGGHLFVAKRLSDPDNKAMKSFPKQSSQTHSHQAPEMANLHRKLQRQLTLNPAYDPRLAHLGGYVDRSHPIISPPQEPYNLLKSQQEQADLMPRSNSQENVHLLQQSSFSSHIPHQPLGRMGSGNFPMSSQVWDTMAEHQTVTRIASAPDSCHQWPPSARMQHLNSTSDTRLNLYPDLQIHPHHQQHLGNFPEMQHHRHWLNQSPGLDPPRPMSSMMGSSWQESGRARGTSQVINQPVRPSSVPPPSIQGLIQQHQGRPASPEFCDSARYRLYFHLASIFPKEQVKSVMELYPQETNPQKICAAILTMFPKG